MVSRPRPCYPSLFAQGDASPWLASSSSGLASCDVTDESRIPVTQVWRGSRSLCLSCLHVIHRGYTHNKHASVFGLACSSGGKAVVELHSASQLSIMLRPPVFTVPKKLVPWLHYFGVSFTPVNDAQYTVIYSSSYIAYDASEGTGVPNITIGDHQSQHRTLRCHSCLHPPDGRSRHNPGPRPQW